MPASPIITGTLKHGTTYGTATTFANLNTASYVSGTGILTLSGTIGASVITIPAGNKIYLDVTTAQSGVTFTIRYDSTTYPSKINLPTTTVVKVDSLDFYDAPYPGGALISNPANGQTVYIRTSVSDPFGYADITSAVLGITTDPASSYTAAPALAAVSNSGATKIYEGSWSIPAEPGVYVIKVAANEGTEGTISDVRSKSVTVAFQDTGTPSTTEFTSASNGTATTSYDLMLYPAGQICLRVTDIDQNTNSSVAETLTVTLSSSTGDSVNVTLTETGNDTGIFVNCVTREASSASPTYLFAVEGSVLTVNYIDPNDPSDATSTSAVMTTTILTLSVSKQLVEPTNGIATIGEQVKFDFTIANPNSVDLHTVAVTDTFPACLTFVSSSVTPTTQVAPTLTWTDIGPLASHASRTIGVTFTVNGICTPGTNIVSASALNPINTSTGTVTDSATLTTTRPELTVTLILNWPIPPIAHLGEDVEFHILVTNSGTTQITSLPLIDNYSAYCMEFKSATAGGSGSGGVVSWTNLANPTALNAGTSTSVDVTFTVQGPCIPTRNLATVDGAIDVNGDPVPVAQGSDIVVTQVTEPTITKDFSPNPILLTGVSTLTFTITNPNSSGAMTGVGFSDTYPLGMENASPLTVVNTTCGGTLDASAGGTTISYSGGSIPANSSCTVSIDVKATASGSLNNVSGAIGAVIGGTGNTASKTLTVNNPPANTVPGTQAITIGVQTTISGISVTDVNGNLSTTRVSVVSGTLNVSLVGGATISGGGNNTNTLTLSGTQTQINAALATLKFTGSVNDTLTVLSTDALTLTDTDTVTINVSLGGVDLSLTKTVNNASPKIGDVVIYTVTITNHSLTTAATTIVVHDALPAGLTLNSSTPSLGSYSASDWTIPTLAANTSATLQLNVTVTQVGAISNTAEVTAAGQTDPDSTPNNHLSAEDDQASVSIGGVFDPPSGIKTFNDGGLPEMEFRMVWINSGNTSAINVQVTDTIPPGTTYVSGSVACVPRGSSTNAGAATAPLSLTATPNSFCGFDSGNNLIQWQGNIGPDNGNLTEAAAANEVVITFRVTVNDNVNQVFNTASARTDTDGDGVFTDEVGIGASQSLSNQATWNRDDTLPNSLPKTGFAPNVITALPEQPASKMYSPTTVSIEIPSINVNIPIVGVPIIDKEWDISWLWNQAGWLNGTAFPGWSGNSVLTGHTTLSNGKSGPFVGLGRLKWGDKIIVHAYGSVYTYEVRENRTVSPNNTSVLRHEEEPWVTLITCKTFNEKTETYSKRIAVRAVLIKVELEK
jgi:LPXTG-site transpeptidase (sortase) family protein